MNETNSLVWIDHINHVRIDNHMCNLRRASASLNAHNRPKALGTTSKYIGVTIRSNGSFMAQISNKCVKENLGFCADELVAAWVRDCMAKELFGNDAKMNNVAQPDGWGYKEKRGWKVDESGAWSRMYYRGGVVTE